MAVLNAQLLSEKAALLARGGVDAERAARALLHTSVCEREPCVAALRAGAVTAILPYLRPSTPTRLLVVLARTFCNFCRHAECELELVAPVLPLIKHLLDCEDQRVLEATCGAITHITHSGGDHARAFWVNAGLIVRLEALLAHSAPSVKRAALDALGNMLATDHAQDLVLGCIDAVVSFLRHGSPALTKSAARTAANILTHPASIQLALDRKLLEVLGSVLTEGDIECKKLAARALGNLCYFGTSNQRTQLASSSSLQPYCAALDSVDELQKLVLAGLNALIQAAEKDDCMSGKVGGGTEKTLCLRLAELGVLNTTQHLLQQTDKDVHQSLKLQTAIIFYMQKKNIIYEGGKVFTVRDITEDLQLSGTTSVGKARAARAARRLASRARAESASRLIGHSNILGPAMRPLISELDNQWSEIQLEASWALAIITTRTPNNCTSYCYLSDSEAVEAVPKLVAVANKNSKATAQAIIALDHITDKETLRDAALRCGAARVLARHLRHATVPARRRACVTLLNRWCR